MQSYSTILGVIELRENGIGFREVQRRYRIGGSTAELIMDRYESIGIPLEDLKAICLSLTTLG